MTKRSLTDTKPSIPIWPIVATILIASVTGCIDLVRQANRWVKGK